MGILDQFKGKATAVRQVSHTTTADKLLLVPIGDVHLGSPTCAIDRFQATLDFVARTDCRVILMGDLMEMATRSSVGSGWAEQTLNPQDQLDALKEVLQPIKGKVLVVLEGNHEKRAYKDVGLNVSKILADYLGVPFGGYSCFVYLRVGKVNYVVHAQHGASGARYLRTKMANLMKTAEHTEADVYLMGHVHELATAKKPCRYFDKRAHTTTMRNKYFVLTGSFLEYEGSYAMEANLEPTTLGVANITFSGERHDVHVST